LGVSGVADAAAVERLVWAAMGRERTLRNETVKKVRLVKAANCIRTLHSETVANKPGHVCRLVDGNYGQTMEHFG
jgi:hypothetical protein